MVKKEFEKRNEILENPKTVFISNCENGWYVLKEILENQPKYKVVGVLTTPKPEDPDKVSGYKDFSELTDKFGVKLYQLTSLKNPNSLQLLNSLSPDIIFCIGWSRIIGKDILDLPPFGVIGMHPTLLPEGRGRAPIPWAILKGLKKSGVTMFYLDEGVDTGDIIDQEEFSIDFEDDAKKVYEKSIQTMVSLAKKNLNLISQNTVMRKKQNSSKATYWEQRRPEDGIIDWSKSSFENYNFIRGLSKPYPGAFGFLHDKKIKIWKAKIKENESNNDEAGLITGKNKTNKSFTVNCKIGSIEIEDFEGIDFDQILVGDHLSKNES
jgi:methionyl-tRNA formyltransferase